MISTSPGAAGTREALPLEPDGADRPPMPAGILHFDFLAGRQPHALHRLPVSRSRLTVSGRAMSCPVAGASVAVERRRAAPRAAPAAAHHILEDVVDAAEAAEAPRDARRRRDRPSAESPPGPQGRFRNARPGRSRLARIARMRAFEAGKARLALGVDLAGVERLALLLVAENFVGRVELGEASRRFRIVRVGVWMQLLGELAEGALDRARARPPRHPQDLIGVAHSVKLHRLKTVPASHLDRNVAIGTDFRNVAA